MDDWDLKSFPRVSSVPILEGQPFVLSSLFPFSGSGHGSIWIGRGVAAFG